MSALLPLYHPTTCLVIDDDQLYLDSFNYNYADVTLCATEYRPEHAIERLLKDAGGLGWRSRKLIYLQPATRR